MKRIPFITLGLAGLCLFIAALFGDAPQSLIYVRQGVLGGELWRLQSAHFSHTDASHLAWNSAALLMIGSLLEQRIGKAIAGVYAVGVLSVNVYLLSTPDLAAYCGLSGVLNTLLIAFLATLIQDKTTRWIGVVSVLLALAKILIEMHLSQALFTQPAWPSVPLAHLYGFMGGVLWAFTKLIFIKQKGDCYA